MVIADYCCLYVKRWLTGRITALDGELGVGFLWFNPQILLSYLIGSSRCDQIFQALNKIE